MDVNDAASAQAVSPQMIPAANHGGRKAEIVGYSLHRVAPAYTVAGRVAGVGRAIFGGRMLARRDRDDQLALRLHVVTSQDMVFLLDGLHGGAIGSGNRGQR